LREQSVPHGAKNLAQAPVFRIGGVVYPGRMKRPPDSTSLRRLTLRGLAAAALACLVLAGCHRSDPAEDLEAIRKQQAAGDLKGTIEPLRELLEERPDDPEANFLYGRALSVSEPSLAVWPLRKAMKDPEWLVPAGSALAYLLLASEDFNEVVKITNQILERDPENVRAFLMRGQAYAHSRRNLDLALADAKRVLEIDRDLTEAYEPMILALLGLGKTKEAGEALEEAGRRISELGLKKEIAAWHCATTAIFHNEKGDLEKARQTWSKCLETYPTDPDVVISAQRFYDDQGEPERSFEILQAAHKAAPDMRLFRVALAQRLHASGDPAAGEALLREATKSDDLAIASRAWADLAKFRQAIGDHSAAADAMQQAVEQRRKKDGSDDPQLLFEYADALVLADRFDQALEVADDLPVPAHKHLIRGLVIQQRGQPAEALEEFDESLRLWPDNPFARYYAAIAAEELGNFERALEEYRNAIRIKAAATDARTRGAALLLALGNPNGALTVLQTGMPDAPLEIEGLLLGMKLSAVTDNKAGMANYLAMIEATHPNWTGLALSEAADGLARRSGPALALGMLTTAPGVDYADPRYAAALRSLVKYAHQAGQSAATRTTLEKILAAQPNSSEFQEILGYDLELSGAKAEAVAAAHSRALELDPANSFALTGLGRLAEVGKDNQAALEYYERATAAEPADPAPQLAAARMLVALGRSAEAEQRLDALLAEHPFLAEAAAERARLDLEQGVATPQTVERARRAVRFGGGPDALDLLSRVHEQRKEPELAARAAEEAKAMREAKPAEGKPSAAENKG
jgi:tetratricopeptide (TPR) repeat protein